VATIGIRGTEYTIQYGQSITGAVGEGQIEVCNSGGCLSVTNGESYYVQGQEFKPVLTNKRTDLPAPPPEAPPQAFKQNETVDNSGDPCALFPAQCGLEALPPAPPALLTGTLEANIGVANGTVFTVYYAPTTATLDSSGLLTHFDDSTSTVILEGPLADTGNDGIVAWGRASGATGGQAGLFHSGQVLHYVVGTPADISALGGLQATYTLLGATQPTSLRTGNVAGTLDKMSMTADFLASSNANISGSMVWTLLNKPLSATFSGGTDGTAFFASGPTNVSGSVDLTGFFAGTKASRAGVVYTVFDSSIDSDGFIGAAALSQDSLGKPVPFTGAGVAHIGVTGGEIPVSVYENRTVTFDGSGLLTQFRDNSNMPVNVAAPISTSGNDGIIAWGRAASSTGGEDGNFNSGSPLHYVVGAVSDISQLGGMRGTYTLLGATTLTGAGTGTLNSMSMTADFLVSGTSITGAMGWTLEGTPLSANFTGSMSGPLFSASGSTSFSGTVNLNGFFAGANAARAGVIYSVHDSSIASGGTFLGAAALAQIGLAPTSSQSRSTRF
jgi:hypothetical protein